MLICPICKERLTNNGKSYLCKNNHCFDISKKGYVNLLLSQGAGKTHGDDKFMTVGRREFLNRGYYSKLLDILCEKTNKADVIADIGCGEGYYTCGIFDSNQTATIIGLDISKSIIDSASTRGRGKNVLFAVANCSRLPLADKSVNCLVSVFAPINESEFLRVLSSDGFVIRVTPGINHLYELKKAVYEHPRFNDELDLKLLGFDIVSSEKLKYKFVCNNDDLKNLFTMTPYYYKTSETDKSKLSDIASLEITADFIITTYKKQDC